MTISGTGHQQAAPDRSCCDQLDFSAVARSRGQRGIPSDQRDIQCLGKGYVDCVIGRHGVSQIPYPAEEQIVWVAGERKGGEVIPRLFGSLRFGLSGATISPQDLSHLQVKEVWRVKRLTG